jgi:hypothetical protein
MSEVALYRSRAEECRAQAAETTLENVRERCLRAADAWIAMAERGERAAAMRVELEKAKAATVGETVIA